MTDSPSSTTQDSTPGATPGPWKIGTVKNGRGYRDEVMVYASNGDLIANFEAPKQADNPRRYIRSETADRANARLGAAAPDLRDELAWAVNWMDAWEGEVMPEWRDWANRARAALQAVQAPETTGGTP